MIKKFSVDIFSNKHKAKVHEVITESRLIVQSYMTGLLIEMGIVTAINTAGFLFIGIQYAFFLGLLAALLNLIPYIGMLIAHNSNDRARHHVLVGEHYCISFFRNYINGNIFFTCFIYAFN